MASPTTISPKNTGVRPQPAEDAELIGHVGGRELTTSSAAEFLTGMGINVGPGFVFREAARAAIKFLFPGFRSLVSAAVVSGATWGLCDAAIAYFIDGKSPEETKVIYQRVKEHKEKEGKPS